MKHFNYLLLFVALLMMNVMNAELKTFGMPTEEAPAEEAPSEEVPAEEAPTEEAPTEEAPTEEVPAEEAPSEEAPSEEAPTEEEMPSASEDSELTTEQPIKFKEEYVISANLAMPIFVGQNLDYRFDKGLGFSLDISTPFSFNLMNKDINISASLKMNNFNVNSAEEVNGTSSYTPMLVGANLNTNLSILDVTLGTGLSMASGQNVSEDYSMTTLYMNLGLGYTLEFENFSFMPESLKGMNATLGGDLIMIMGAPDETGDTSNIINLGLSLGYPVFF